MHQFDQVYANVLNMGKTPKKGKLIFFPLLVEEFSFCVLSHLWNLARYEEKIACSQDVKNNINKHHGFLSLNAPKVNEHLTCNILNLPWKPVFLFLWHRDLAQIPVLVMVHTWHHWAMEWAWFPQTSSKTPQFLFPGVNLWQSTVPLLPPLPLPHRSCSVQTN